MHELYASAEVRDAVVARWGEDVAPDDVGNVIRRFERAVGEAVEPPRRLVKTIGDAAMLVAPEPAAVVDAVVGLVERSRDESPLLRGGVASGGPSPSCRRSTLRSPAPGGPALTAVWLRALDEALADDGSVGLIVADAAVAAAGDELAARGVEFREVDRFDTDTRLALVPASAVKGLEFDQVVLVEPADIADPALGPTGLRRLYTALTRAVLGLTIVHAKPLPAALDPGSPG